MIIISFKPNRLKRREIKKSKKLCRGCRKHYAIFIRRKEKRKKVTRRLGRGLKVKGDHYHDLCPRCNRSLIQSAIVRQLFSAGV